MSLREITQMRIEKFKQDRLKTKSQRGTTFSAASVNHELALLSSVFTMARKNRMIRENPCLDVKKLEVDNERERFLTYEEESRLFAQLTGRRSHLRPIVTVALHTGIRRGALLALRWQEVDFTRNVITITKGKSKNKKMYVVPMNETVRAELAALRLWSNGCEWVFTNSITGVSIKDIKNGFVSACKDARLENFRRFCSVTPQHRSLAHCASAMNVFERQVDGHPCIPVRVKAGSPPPQPSNINGTNL